MCTVICVGEFKTCEVELPDLSLIVETQPRDVYFFLGGDLKHRVGCPSGYEEVNSERWSWILFTHGTMYQCPKSGIETDTPWLHHHGTAPSSAVDLDERMETLESCEEQDPSNKSQQPRDRQDHRKNVACQSKCNK